MGGKPRFSAEEIERFRQIGLRLDREGRFFHEGRQVTHRGLQRALLRWLDRLADGRAIVRLDDTRFAYVEVEDAHLLVLSLEWRGDRGFAHLNDGSVEELDYGSLHVGPHDALYCHVRGGRLRARLTTPAYYSLAERIVERGDHFALRAAGKSFALESAGAPA